MYDVFIFDENLTLGQKVRIYRVAKRWTQDDLAYEAGVTQGAVSALERDLKVYSPYKHKILTTLGLESEEPVDV